MTFFLVSSRIYILSIIDFIDCFSDNCGDKSVGVS
jgi:hypothetical protein